MPLTTATVLGHDGRDGGRDASDMSERVVDDGSTVCFGRPLHLRRGGDRLDLRPLSRVALRRIVPGGNARPDQHERSTHERRKASPYPVETAARPAVTSGCIDEIVLTGVDMVHVEQMNDRCWWIGITLADGARGTATSRPTASGEDAVLQQESSIEWALDACTRRTSDDRNRRPECARRQRGCSLKRPLSHT